MDCNKKRILNAMTIELTQTFKECHPEFECNITKKPLTNPNKPLGNHGHDNENNDYILYMGDSLGDKENQKYQILKLLGQGTFGQVVKCKNLKTKNIVAIKVIKNKQAYFNQSMVEVTILELLNSTYDRNDRCNIIRKLDTFIFRKHLCIVFEVLGANLYEVIKQTNFKGLLLPTIRMISAQILDALSVLSDAKIIHCDLKPENILVKSLNPISIKLIDFGSACHEHQTVYTYIQSRFYRSPEVILGVDYSTMIDIWSLGCIVVELFLGLPLFPGSSEFNQITRIVDTLGYPPFFLLEFGKNSRQYFNKSQIDGKHLWSIKQLQQYNSENNTKEEPSKRYFPFNSLPELLLDFKVRAPVLENREQELYHRKFLLDFVKGLLQMNPLERLSAKQAKLHPFITGEFLRSPLMPIMETVPVVLQPFHLPTQPILPQPSLLRLSDPNYRSRPRANTISSSNLNTVPHHLMKLTEVNSGQLTNRYPPRRKESLKTSPNVKMHRSSPSYSSLLAQNSFSYLPSIPDQPMPPNQIQQPPIQQPQQLQQQQPIQNHFYYHQQHQQLQQQLPQQPMTRCPPSLRSFEEQGEDPIFNFPHTAPIMSQPVFTWKTNMPPNQSTSNDKFKNNGQNNYS